MVMISPCAGCDASILAHVLAIVEMVSGLITILKSTWWWWWFRIPQGVINSSNNNDELQPENHDDEESNNATASATQCTVHVNQQPDNVSTASEEDFEENTNNTLWMLTGLTMGSVNITLAVLFLVGLTNVNYLIIVTWCLTFPAYYIIDCTLLTLLLKHCTSKERFEKCRTDYIYSTICTFIFHSYVLWVAISVIHWCNCRRDPYKCRFTRDYCHSFNLNLSSIPYYGTNSGQKGDATMLI